jgi:phospholipid-binding lipoprotein MlaA
MQNWMLKLALIISLFYISGCATVPAETKPSDRWESTNRAIFTFNTTLDQYLLKPVSRGYAAVTPRVAQQGVSNFFDNVGYLNTVSNDFLQGKFKHGFRGTARFLCNSTLGIAGLFDVATPLGLEGRDEDLGQTLAVWGVDSGPYVMLPVWGPSTARDAPGRVWGMVTDASFYLVESSVSLPLTMLGIIDKRARLGDYDKALEQTLDPYIFTREAYVQRRNFVVFDGNPPEPDILDDLEEFDAE